MIKESFIYHILIKYYSFWYLFSKYLNNNISLSSEKVQLPYTIPFTNINIPITILLSFIIHDDPFFILVWILYHFWGELTINSIFPLLIFTKMIGNSLYTSNLTFTQNWNITQFNITIHIILYIHSIYSKWKVCTSSTKLYRWWSILHTIHSIHYSTNNNQFAIHNKQSTYTYYSLPYHQLNTNHSRIGSSSRESSFMHQKHLTLFWSHHTSESITNSASMKVPQGTVSIDNKII